MALLAVGAAPLVAGCTASADGGADGQIRQRVGAQAGSLAALYGPAVAVAFAGFRDHHRAHQDTMLSGATTAILPASGKSPGAAAPRPVAQQLPPAGLSAAERAAMAAGAPDLGAASGRLAGLLVNIAACRALHCAALDDSGKPGGTAAAATALMADASADANNAEPPVVTPTPGDLAAAQAILGAEHAAVYAYGALTPHLRGAQRDQAHELYELHRQLRDTLETGIAAHGATPAATVAAYAFPQQPDDAASAQALARYVESRVAAVCANAAVVTTSAGRPYASWAATGACLRAYAWGAPITAFPATVQA